MPPRCPIIELNFVSRLTVETNAASAVKRSQPLASKREQKKASSVLQLKLHPGSYESHVGRHWYWSYDLKIWTFDLLSLPRRIWICAWTTASNYPLPPLPSRRKCVSFWLIDWCQQYIGMSHGRIAGHVGWPLGCNVQVQLKYATKALIGYHFRFLDSRCNATINLEHQGSYRISQRKNVNAKEKDISKTKIDV